jgi:hypothetical protein
MNENIKKYQLNNIKTEDRNKDERQAKVVDNRSNHILFESKYEKPYPKKVLEQKVENNREISKINIENIAVIDGKGMEKEKLKENSINYRCNKEEEKPYVESNKMNKCIISLNRRNNNLEEKVVNNIITNNEIQKSKKIKNDKINNKKNSFIRNKTDEDLSQKKGETSFDMYPKNLTQDIQSKLINKNINKTSKNRTYNSTSNNQNTNIEISKPHKQYSFTNSDYNKKDKNKYKINLSDSYRDYNDNNKNYIEDINININKDNSKNYNYENNEK